MCASAWPAPRDTTSTVTTGVQHLRDSSVCHEQCCWGGEGVLISQSAGDCARHPATPLGLRG
eukprot:15478056-Alexandrium_andersonii.AAC.1